jgi:CheY-like chemotaxis protein
MSAKSRVLIVDDEPDVVANWARLLGREDYTCITTTEGAQALTLLETERPDVVLTDLKMPDMNGIELLSELPKQPAGPCVILMTSS